MDSSMTHSRQTLSGENITKQAMRVTAFVVFFCFEMIPCLLSFVFLIWLFSVHINEKI